MTESANYALLQMLFVGGFGYYLFKIVILDLNDTQYAFATYVRGSIRLLQTQYLMYIIIKALVGLWEDGKLKF